MPLRMIKWTVYAALPLAAGAMALFFVDMVPLWSVGLLVALTLAGGFFVARQQQAVEARMQREIVRLRGRVAELGDDEMRRSRIIDEMIDTLPDPLIFLDSEQRISRVNKAARAMSDGAKTGNALSMMFRQPEFLRTVEGALDDSSVREVDLKISSPVEQNFKVRMLPINEPRSMQQSNRRSALLLVMQDVTQAHRMEQMRADFVANVSHELRTPLTSVIGFVETLLGPARDDTEAHERFLGIMKEQSGRMLSIIEDLLSLSKIELDEHSRPSDAVDLRNVLGKVEDVLAMKAAEREMPLQFDLPEGMPAVMGDENQLIQIFQNLIDNAIKYGKPGSPVDVSAQSPQEGKLSVSVSDYGAGISQEHLPRLTERFYRIDTARSREMGGTGLGLAIVKHIVKRHRGRITVDSEVGRGTCFTVTLPIF